MARSNAVRKGQAAEAGGAPELKAQPGGATDAAALDRIIHERVRLGIVSALAVNQSLTFNELKRLLESTDGNLSVHARKLEEAGYVRCTKSFEGRPRAPNSRSPRPAGGRWSGTWGTWRA